MVFVKFEEIPYDDKDIEPVVTRLDEYSGRHQEKGAVLRRFKADIEYEDPNLLENFLRSEELNASIDGLNTLNGFRETDYGGESIKRPSDDFRYNALFVEGYVAWLLTRGGAYYGMEDKAKAKQLGRNFDEEIIEGRYNDFKSVWRMENIQWSDWFWGVEHWDETLVMADYGKQEVWILMFTSSD